MRPTATLLTVMIAIAGTSTVLGAERSSQVEVDRIVVRVGGRIITQSDIRQAKLLKLVDDSSSDQSVRRGLEDRWLALAEMARATPIAAPLDADVATRRSEWERSLGDATTVSRLLSEAGMPDADLREWMRDDVRIRAYLRRQFGMLSDAERPRAESDWRARLRQRADLR